jgi:hypothetical protein
LVVVARLAPERFGKVQEVCLSFKKTKPIPISELTRSFIGTNSPHLVKKPKILIFIDEGIAKKIRMPTVSDFKIMKLFFYLGFFLLDKSIQYS